MKKIQFESTNLLKSNENRKAEVKNENLSVLQFWFHGSRDTPIHCLISGTPGLYYSNDYVTKKQRQRFDIDFNHIRQQFNDEQTTPGASIDKGKYSPSAVFREKRLKNEMYHDSLIELMTTMAVSAKVHKEITSDSTRGDLVLTDFPKEYWPWGLRLKRNFDKFCFDVRLSFKDGKKLNYRKFKKALSDISQPSIVDSFLSGDLYLS